MTIQVIKAKDLRSTSTLNTIIYGGPGVGKTTFAATADKPIIIDLEGGTISIMNSNAHIIKADNYDDIQEAFKLAIAGDYKTLCLDSLTRYAEILIERIVKDDHKEKPQIQHWGELILRIRKLMWALKARDINTIFICLEKETEVDGQLIKRPFLNGSLVQSVPAIMDVTGYLYCSEDGERHLSVNPTSKWYAKHRAPMTGRILEDIEPDFKLLYNKILGGHSEKQGD